MSWDDGINYTYEPANLAAQAYGQLPQGWNALSNLENIPSPDNIRDLFANAGYTGKAGVYAGDPESLFGQYGGSINPDVYNWLAQNQYTVGQMRDGGKYQTAIFNASGQPVSQADYTDKGVGPIKYIVPAMLGAMAGGAGLYALGGLGAGAAGGAGAGAGAGIAPLTAAELAASVSSSLPALTAADVTGAALGASGNLLGGAGLAAGAGLAGSGLTGSLGTGSLTNAAGTAGNALTQAGQAAGGGMGWADLLGGLLGTGAQVYGANQAADQLGEATKQANELQKYMYDTTRSDNMPALSARNSGIAMMQSLLSDPSTITKDPGYQFQLAEGTKTLNNGAAARGMTYSGAQGKALQRYGQDYAGTKLDQSFNRLSALASGGQPGASTIAAGAQNYGNTVGSNITNQGNVNAMPYIVGGNALGDTINGLTAYGSRNGWWSKP